MDLEENYKCSICLDTIEEPVYKLIKCHHTFHKSCLQQWFVKNNNCPLCRQTVKDIFQVTLIKNMIWKGFVVRTIKVKLMLELLPNKINFYKLPKKRKRRGNHPVNLVPLSDDEMIFYPTAINNYMIREDVLHSTHQKQAVKLQIYFAILYSHISKMYYQKKYIKFTNLKLPRVFGFRRSFALHKPFSSVKLKFTNAKESWNFFEIVKKRFEIYRSLNE